MLLISKHFTYIFLSFERNIKTIDKPIYTSIYIYINVCVCVCVCVLCVCVCVAVLKSLRRTMKWKTYFKKVSSNILKSL